MPALERPATCFGAALVVALLGARAEADRGDRLLRGGAIYTLDRARPWATALVLRAGRIAYVGDDAGAAAFAGPEARAIALDGRMVLPGFHDSHVHPMTGGMRLLRCALDGSMSAERVYAAVRACAAARRQEPWLLGSGWSPKAFPKGGPTRRKLDALVPDRPALISTEDGFTAWANTRALSAAGIRVDGKGAPVAGIERDPRTHEPTGIVKDDAINLVRRHAPPPTEGDYRESLRRATAMANRFGITSLVDASASAAVVDAYTAADQAGELTVRVVAAQRIDVAHGEEQVAELAALRDRSRGRRFRADGAKIFLDGEIDRHTAAMLDDYAGPPAGRGELFIQPDALDRLVRRLDAGDFLIHMHAMGDGAVHAGLDAIERAMQANGARDRRHQIAHIGVASPADIVRFGRLGVVADFQPFWAQAGDEANAPAQAALGPSRSRWMYPIGSVASAGARIVAGSDWPSPSMNPLDAIQIAVTRQPLDGSKPPQQPEQRVTLAAILAAYTLDAAWAARAEASVGSIEAGKAADLVVLDRNLFAIDASRLHEARVLLTLLDGEPVYREPGFAWP